MNLRIGRLLLAAAIDGVALDARLAHSTRVVLDQDDRLRPAREALGVGEVPL